MAGQLAESSSASLWKMMIFGTTNDGLSLFLMVFQCLSSQLYKFSGLLVPTEQIIYLFNSSLSQRSLVQMPI